MGIFGDKEFRGQQAHARQRREARRQLKHQTVPSGRDEELACTHNNHDGFRVRVQGVGCRV